MPKKILLADDSITIQKVVELTFSDGDYEVTAVNNGAKAVAKLAEMRPDIILSDIIMPEKNGYEVCEYVKSHPDFRNIPVVLLTGTFEPFDPDRAEKAGCDAVVTKPFESQSLIHKVEELIAQAQSASASAASAAPEPEPAPSPWMEEAPAPESSAFSTASGGFPAAGSDTFTNDNDIFAAPPAPQATTEMPFDAPPDSPFGAPPPVDAFSGETRAFPKMSFEEMQQMASGTAPTPPPPPAAPEPPPAPEPSPWDETPPAAPSFRAPTFEDPQFDASYTPPSYNPPSFDTPSFETPSFNESSSFSPAAAEPETESPFGAPPPAEEFSGETRAFPRMSFEEMQQMAAGTAPNTPPPAPPSAPEPPPAASPWDEQDAPAFGGETRAFPKMSFDDLQQMAASTPPPPPEPEVSPWGEPESAAPAFGGDTPAFGSDTPAFGSDTSAFGGNAPAFGGDTPAFGSDTPAFGGDTPAFGSDTPAFSDDAPAFSGETRAFPKLSFDDLQSSQPAATEPEPVPSPWSDSTADRPWSLPETSEPEPEGPAAVESFPAAAAPFGEPASAPFNEPPEQVAEAAVPEDLPFAEETTSEPELEPVESLMSSEPAEEPAWEPAATAAAAAEPEEPVVPPAALAPEAPPMAIARSSDLTDEQIDRIARRVVELMSDQVIRNIAWEVIPDLAEMVVKERIRQLEAEA